MNPKPRTTLAKATAKPPHQPRTNLIICPGIHSSKLNDGFLNGLQLKNNYLIFPEHEKFAYSSEKILTFIQKYADNNFHIIFIAFSAGVVGAIAAALQLQKHRQIKAFIALDGWGVPLMGNFPIYRLSHDYFTHWSSNILGAGEHNFYAYPPVPHLSLWQFPQQVQGYYVKSLGCQIKCNAAEFIADILAKY